MKLSVSLPTDDVAFLDAYATDQGLASRSAAVLRAIRVLRAAELEAQYASAFDEWDASDEASAWDRAAADGVGGGRPADGS